MIKKSSGILALVFLVMFGIGTGALAQGQVQMQITMYKDASSAGETYGASFDFYGDDLRKAAKVMIDGPRGKRIWVNNSLKLNRISLSVDSLSFADFDLWFPEGRYLINLTPATLGRVKVEMTHNFPSVPVIISPVEGSVDVSTDPVITWAPVTGINSLRLRLKDDAGFEFGVDLPFNTTSYDVPENLLKPNTRYEVSLDAKMTDSGGNGLITTATISFTTLAQ
jgi:hypothetical protein